MRLSESIDIRADASEVWPWVADPVRQADWNAKISSIGRERNGPVSRGERYEMSYRLGTNERLSHVEAIDVDRPRRVAFLHRSEHRGQSQESEEIYELVPRGDVTRVTMTIDLSRTGVPWPFRVIGWIIHRLGTHRGERPLAALKRRVETTRVAS